MCSDVFNFDQCFIDLHEMFVLDLTTIDFRPVIRNPGANDDCVGVRGRCSRCSVRPPIHLNGFGCLITFSCSGSGSCNTATGCAVTAHLVGGSGWLVGGSGWYP